MPVDELHRYLSALPADADVVAYCRGPYCVRADEAVRELSRRGMRAQRLADGFPEWKRAGLPVGGRRTGGVMTGSEAKATELFTERYRVGPTDVTRRIERAVIGGDWGANGYTTLAQAGKLGAELGLGPGVRLLDLGAGQGWPGVYLATATGCR